MAKKKQVTKVETGKYPVSIRAVIQRINRKLAAVGKKLKRCRSERSRKSLGDYFVINDAMGVIVERFIDLETFGREVGALSDYEAVDAE